MVLDSGYSLRTSPLSASCIPGYERVYFTTLPWPPEELRVGYFIKIPKFIIPSNLDEIIANQKPRPLNVCSTCKYVKCNCGGCHRSGCQDAQACGYGSSGSAAASAVGGDGKVWCGECGGNYLP